MGVTAKLLENWGPEGRRLSPDPSEPGALSHGFPPTSALQALNASCDLFRDLWVSDIRPINELM